MASEKAVREDIPATEERAAGRRSAVGVLLLFVFALLVRMQGLPTLDPHTDEHHWLSRSAKVIHKLRTDPINATTHLGHPGISPALIMAGSQWVSEKVNLVRKKNPSDSGYIHPLIASRVAMAVTASLAIPLMFLLTQCLFGTLPALFGALLLALDPHHVGLSRLAHLDAALTTFVLGATLLYFVGIVRKRPTLIVASGLVWGLAIATKPTAAALVAAFLCYRILRWGLLKTRPFPLSWVDVWAVVAGHAVLVAIGTRFWVHRSDFYVRLQIRTPFARFFYKAGQLFDKYEVLGYLLLASLAGLLLWSYRRWRYRNGSPWLVHFSAFCGLFLAILMFAPALPENAARYWSWAAGLSGLAHDGYGHSWPSPHMGYITLLLASLPEGVLLGVALSLASLVILLVRARYDERTLFVFFLAIAIALWLTPLQISSKQGWRYALPIVPFLYLLCVWGYSRVLGLADPNQHLPLLRTSAGFGICLVVLLLQGGTLVGYQPNQHVFVSRLMGGLPRAAEHNIFYPAIGLIQAAEFLSKEALSRNQPIQVTVVGDATTMQLSHALGSSPKGEVRYGFFPQGVATYLLAPVALRDRMLGQGWRDSLRGAPVFSYTFQRAHIYDIYPVFPLTLETEFQLPVKKMSVSVGQFDQEGCLHVQTAEGTEGVVANHSGARIRAPEIEVLLFGHTKQQLPAGLSRALTVRLSDGCRHSFSSAELSSWSDKEPLRFSCQLEGTARLIPELRWNGTTDFCFKSLSIRRRGDDAA